MPLKVSLKSSELKASKVVSEPGWFKFKLDNVTREKNKAGDAYNYIFDWIGVEGEVTDVPLREYISEKKSQIGRIGEILTAAGMKVDEDKGIENVDLEELIGNVQEIKIKHGDFNGQPKNEAAGHRRPRD